MFVSLLCLLLPVGLHARHSELNTRLAQAIEGKKAEVGIAVIIDGKDTIALNNETRYPTMSVYKFHQALALANYMEQRNLPFETILGITQSDLKPDTYSPLRDQYPNGGINMSVAELLKYTLQQSDNNACDILFRYQGGTEAVNRYIHSLGITDCLISATEEEMHQDLERCYQNWTTPVAAAGLVDLFLRKPLFGAAYKDFIYQTMVECQTGKDRLPAPLTDKGLIIGHKTGTGGLNAQGQLIGTNDIGFILLPNGHRYSIAVLIKDSEENPQATSSLIGEISRIVYEYVLKLTSAPTQL
ncbi:class A beta-lactamase, subclass A2 [Bacteroides reticulotermitis]|uniref:class A beta-lactamase, subclass A2 n=1 Tax=Bacteroides reticulotermitis TaxID=1133319 RepID=UPI003A846BE5